MNYVYIIFHIFLYYPKEVDANCLSAIALPIFCPSISIDILIGCYINFWIKFMIWVNLSLSLFLLEEFWETWFSNLGKSLKGITA